MPKRARGGASDNQNPLSSARKDSGSKRNGKKADRNAQGLWHRKSGAGYHLFLEYYGSQPSGVVVANDEDFIGKGTINAALDGTDAISNKSNGGCRGMSRAARRRRQKKQAGNFHEPRNPDEDADLNIGDSSPSSSSFACKLGEVSPQTQLSLADATHPLMLAFSSTNRHPHLTRFVHALSRPLPLTLRFRENEQASSSRMDLKESLSATTHSELIAPVTYDPTKSIYQSTPMSSLHKSNLSKISPNLKQLVVDGSMNGTLARQELGSMLPVICLRSVGAIRGGSKVLDICASPGSKTLQALEIVCANHNKGKVIANDIHSGRLDSLREAVLRSGLPEYLTSRVTYTNYDASTFPAPKSGKLFDAVICDVPCGGDGTIRKDRHILPMWSPNISSDMHDLQLKILKRALELVKVGGFVCYSTCSLNPIEDEAVVAGALGGSHDGADYELCDWSPNSLPGFLRRPGVHTWKVAFYGQDDEDDEQINNEDDDFESLSFFDSLESALDGGMTDARPTFWPNKVENERLGLGRCTRLFPQDQDSGGFFLALIKRAK